MKLLPKLFVAFGVVVAALIVLAPCNYFLLWKPSLQGKCGGQTTFRSPAPYRPHLAELRRHVVGKNLWIAQYRWLRRRFKAIGTTLSLVRELPSTAYEGNVVLNEEKVPVVGPVFAGFPIWVSPRLIRVGQTETPTTATSISLSGARGEILDSQVVVTAPEGGLTNVNLSASALTGPAGAAIAATNVTLYREHYISVKGSASYGGGSNPPLGTGTYAEPLIPFNDPETGSPLCGAGGVLLACNASITAGQNQPYWIDIFIPRGSANTPPGIYTGTISVTSTQGSGSIPVSLTIWNFELPMQPSEKSLLTGFLATAPQTTTTLDKALMRNRTMGWYDVAANASSDITTFGLNRSGLDSYFFIGIQCSGTFSSVPTAAQTTAAASNFPAGLALDYYAADELNGCPASYAPIKTLGMNSHAATPRVSIVGTYNAPDPNLFNEGDGQSAIDHWVLLDSMQRWPKLPFTSGGDLWSYVSCNGGFGNTPEWTIDFPPINERIQSGFLNWTQGAKGILYSRPDGWTAGNAIGSWNNVNTNACGVSRPGSEILIYPPGPIGSTESAPGIRLKSIRDGIQDYEYAQMLQNTGQGAFVTSTLLPIATSWTNWTKSEAAIERARLTLGLRIAGVAVPSPRRKTPHR